MDIDRIKEFLVLADCLNYSKAAAQLFITQPVLSRHIGYLEKDVGASLFTRDTHNVKLTPVGELCLNEFRKVIFSYDSAMDTIQKYIGKMNNTISVGFLGYAISFINDLVKQFRFKYPWVEMELKSTDLDPLMRGMANAKIDVGFVTDILNEDIDGYNVLSVKKGYLYILLPEDCALLKKDSVSIKDLSDFPLITYDRAHNPYTKTMHEKLFKKYGVSMNSIKEVENYENGILAVDIWGGGLIIPEHLLVFAKNCEYRKISDEGLTYSVNMIWRKGETNEAVKLFVNYFKDYKAKENLG